MVGPGRVFVLEQMAQDNLNLGSLTQHLLVFGPLSVPRRIVQERNIQISLSIKAQPIPTLCNQYMRFLMMLLLFMELTPFSLENEVTQPIEQKQMLIVQVDRGQLNCG